MFLCRRKGFHARFLYCSKTSQGCSPNKTFGRSILEPPSKPHCGAVGKSSILGFSKIDLTVVIALASSSKTAFSLSFSVQHTRGLFSRKPQCESLRNFLVVGAIGFLRNIAHNCLHSWSGMHVPRESSRELLQSKVAGVGQQTTLSPFVVCSRELLLTVS